MNSKVIWWIVGAVVLLLVIWLIFSMTKSDNTQYNPAPGVPATPPGGQSKLADILNSAFPYFDLIDKNKKSNQTTDNGNGGFWGGSETGEVTGF